MRRNSKLVHKLFTAVSCGVKRKESDASDRRWDIPIHAMATRVATVFFDSLGRFVSLL